MQPNTDGPLKKACSLKKSWNRNPSLSSSNLIQPGKFGKMYLKRKIEATDKCSDLIGLSGDQKVPVSDFFTIWLLCRALPTQLINVSSDSAESQPYFGFKCFSAVYGCKADIPVTRIGYLPVVPHSPSNPAVVEEVIKSFQKTARELGLSYTVVTCDQAVYEIVHALRVRNPEAYSDVVLRMGGLHILMNFMGAIGHIMKCSGLEEVIYEAGILLEGTAKKVMSGKPYYKALAAHTLVLEAISILYWEAFEDFCAESDDSSCITIFEEMGDLLQNLKISREGDENLNCLKEKLTALSPWLERFETSRARSKTHKFWKQYKEMVLVLWQFLYSERSGDWDGHLEGASKMLPYLVACGHYKYGTCLIEYLAEMQGLPQEVDQAFHNGLFNVKRRNAKFNCISPDHAVESTINLDSKTEGGMTGITMNELALVKWTLTLPFCASVSSTFTEMLRIVPQTEFDSSHHEDHPFFVLRQHMAVDKVKSVLEARLNPFRSTDEDMLNIYTLETVDSEIADSLLSVRSVGSRAVDRYLDGEKGAFSKVKVMNNEKAKQKKATNTSSAVNSLTNVELQTVKRVLVSVDFTGERGLHHLKNLLSHELLPYAPSIFQRSAISGMVVLRTGTKSALLEYLKTKISLSEWPVNLEISSESTHSRVVDLMPYLRSHPPNPSETVESYGKRTFSTLVSFNSNVKELHVLADRYDGIFGYSDEEGKVICLKDCGGCHEQRGCSNRSPVALGRHSNLDDWNSLLSNSKTKARLIELLFGEFENSVHLLQAGFTVYLSGGF